MLFPWGSAGLGLVWQPCSHLLHRRHDPELLGWWLGSPGARTGTRVQPSGSYGLLNVGAMDVLASKYLWRILTTPCCFPLGLTSQSNE